VKVKSETLEGRCLDDHCHGQVCGGSWFVCFANFSQYIDRLGANEEAEKLLMVEPMTAVKEEVK
jgi:hypothetical protein